MKHIHFKQSRIILGLYYIGRLLHLANSIYLLRLALSPADESLYRNLQNAIFLLASLNLREGTVYFFPKLHTQPKPLAAFFGYTIAANTLTYLAWACFLGFIQVFVSGTPITDNLFYLGIILCKGYIVLLSIVLKTWCNMRRRSLWPNLLQCFVLPLTTAMVLGLCYFMSLSFAQCLVAMLFPYLLHLYFIADYVFRHIKIKLSWDFSLLPQGFTRRFTLYNLSTVLANRYVIILIRLGLWFAASILGSAAVTMYTRLLPLALFIEIPIRALEQTMAPHFSMLLTQKNYAGLKTAYASKTGKQLFFSALTFVLLYINLPWLYASYSAASVATQKQTYTLFMIIGLTKLVTTFCYSSRVLLILSRYFRYAILNSIALIVGSSIVLWSIHTWGLYGAAGSIFCVLSVIGFVNIALVWHFMHLHPFSWDLCYSLVLVGMGIALTSIQLTSSMPGLLLQNALALILAWGLYKNSAKIGQVRVKI